jgi:hypothetical protein
MGLVDTVGGLAPVAEAQARWVADALAGRLEMPSAAEMRDGIAAEAAFLKRRFVDPRPHTLLRDRYRYLRLLAADRRKRTVRRRRDTRAGAPAGLLAPAD